MKLISWTVSSLATTLLLAGCVVDSAQPPQTPPPPPPDPGSPPVAVAPAQPAVVAPAAAPVAAPLAAPAAQPPYQPPPIPPTPPAQHKLDEAAGEPKLMHAGDPQAVWVWHNGGTEWHVRFTTPRQLHRFSGRIGGDAGVISDVRPIRPELNDRLRLEGKELTFDVSTNVGLDGFDFHATGGHCTTFYFLVDEQPDVSRIFIGSLDRHPNGVDFNLCR